MPREPASRWPLECDGARGGILPEVVDSAVDLAGFEVVRPVIDHHQLVILAEEHVDLSIDKTAAPQLG